MGYSYRAKLYIGSSIQVWTLIQKIMIACTWLTSNTFQCHSLLQYFILPDLQFILGEYIRDCDGQSG